MSRTAERLAEVARRKERLIGRAEAQRAAIAESFRGLGGPIGVVDRGLEVARFLRAHPVLLAAGVAALAVFRRRSLLSMARYGVTAWRLWRWVSAWSLGRPV